MSGFILRTDTASVCIDKLGDEVLITFLAQGQEHQLALRVEEAQRVGVWLLNTATDCLEAAE